MIIYLAGLLAIPREVYEAASIDGAEPWRQFRSITFPLDLRLRGDQHHPRVQGVPERLRHHRRPHQRRPRHLDLQRRHDHLHRLHER